MDWIIYLIIFGLIFSMLNKQKKRPSEPQRPQRPQTIEIPKRDFQDSSPKMDWPLPFPDLEREWPGYELDTKPIKQTDKEKVQETFSEIKPNKTIIAKKVKNEATDNETDQLNKRYIASEPTVNQVIQGVIWSEILGPPRSKRPHHALYHQRTK